VIISELLKFNKTWDLYSLSIIYLKFLHFLFRDGFFESKFIVKFSQLLLDNISPDPNNRTSIDENKTRYRDLFFIDESLQNYLTIINNFKYDSTHVQKIKQEISRITRRYNYI
jgi:hypothetical protein